MNEVYIMTDEDPLEQDMITYISNVAQYVLKQNQQDSVHCSIVFLSPSSMFQYNKQYAHKDYVPDVLSFTVDATNIPHVHINEDSYIGDVMICRDQVYAQANIYQVDHLEELTRTIIHGILHLLGFEHDSYDAKEPMFIKQEQLLSNFINNQRGR